MLVHTLTEEKTQRGNKLHLEMIEVCDPGAEHEDPRYGVEIRVYVNDKPKQFRQIWSYSVEELEKEFINFIDGLKY